MVKRFRLPIAASLCGLMAGCGLSGTYPTLAPRPAELAQAGADQPVCQRTAACGPGVQPTQPNPAPVQAAADPALTSRVSQLLSDAQAGETSFRRELPATERAVSSAGAAGSDSWAEAQQALSRLETSRSRTAVAAAELDALERARIEAAGSSNEADLGAITAASDQVRALIQGQDQEIDRLSSRLAAI